MSHKEEQEERTGFSDEKLLKLLITGFVVLTYVFIFLKIVLIN